MKILQGRKRGFIWKLNIMNITTARVICSAEISRKISKLKYDWKTEKNRGKSKKIPEKT